MERTYAPQPSVLDIPDWMAAPAPNTPALTPREMRDLTDQTYAAFFETVLEKVAGGMTFSDVVREDERYDLAKYNYWVQKDTERRARLNDAKMMGAPLIEDQMMGIADAMSADGTTSMEDVQRSTLKINSRKWLLGVWHKQRYGSSHQIDVNNQPLAENSLEMLADRLVRLRRPATGEVVDVVAKEAL